MAEAPPLARFARVYDIVNAGPRHRFTVSGKLVLNCVHGIGFGMGASKLYNMHQEDFKDLREAKELLGIIKEQFPKVIAFQERIKEKAYNQGFLRSRWGFIRRFNDVAHWDYKKRALVPGDDAEAAIAFLPANDAFGYMRMKMLKLQDLGWAERYGMVSNVHDSLMFHCKRELVEEAIRNIHSLMSSPEPVLSSPICPEGLWIGCEAAVGETWGSLEEVKV